MLNKLVIAIVLIIFSSLSIAATDPKHSLKPANSLKQADEYYAKGQIKEALNLYQEIVKDKYVSAESWFKLARTQMLNNQNVASVKSYQKAIALDQNHALAFIGMAIAYFHIGQYNHAKASLNEAARIDKSKQQQIKQVIWQIENKLKSLDEATAKSSYMAH